MPVQREEAASTPVSMPVTKGKKRPATNATNAAPVDAAPIPDLKPASAPAESKPVDVPASVPVDTDGPINTTLDTAPTEIVDHPLTTVDAPNNAAPMAVPAEPTELDIAGDLLYTSMRDEFTAWYALRPQLSTWREPSKEEKNALAMKLAEEKYDGDIVAAVMQLQNDVAAQRAASGQDKQNALDLSYLQEAKRRLATLLGSIDGMIESKGGKTTSKRASTSNASTATASAPRSSWAELNPKLIEWARKMNLPYFALVDKTRGGYTGEDGQHYHAVVACADGRWQKAEYDTATHAITPIEGAYVSRPIYFKAPKGEDVKWPIEAMFGIPLVTRDGKILNLPGINIESRGNITPLGQWSAVREEAVRLYGIDVRNGL